MCIRDRYRALRAENKMAPTSSGSYASRKTWVQRFMGKWSATRGIMVTHEAENSRDVVRKVRQGSAKNSSSEVQFRPQNRIHFPTPNWVPQTELVNKPGAGKQAKKRASKLGLCVANLCVRGVNFLAVATLPFEAGGEERPNSFAIEL